MRPVYAWLTWRHQWSYHLNLFAELKVPGQNLFNPCTDKHVILCTDMDMAFQFDSNCTQDWPHIQFYYTNAFQFHEMTRSKCRILKAEASWCNPGIHIRTPLHIANAAIYFSIATELKLKYTCDQAALPGNPIVSCTLYVYVNLVWPKPSLHMHVTM